jgi:CheY-like chemotaxis protein
MYFELASARGSLLATDFDPSLAGLHGTGDPTRLRQVLANLLGNALKFTERGTITLGCRRRESPHGDARIWLVYSVRDTGVGIAADALPHLFQRFMQADATTNRRFGGSGLGLALCKHLVALMGGDIQVHSTPGQGSHFWFDLPLEPGAANEGTVPTVPTVPTMTPTDGARILVAEDNPINQQVVQSLLGHLGAQVQVVDNGIEALQAVRQAHYDLVLMDCQMPQMDGFEATRRIRAWEQQQGVSRRVRIVALTANALAGDREACLAAGMDDYLAKPVSGAALDAVLARHLGRRTRVRGAPERPADGPAAADGSASPLVFDPAVLENLPMVANGSKPDFARTMRELFATTTTKVLAEIEAAVAAGQRDAVLSRLHSLKSSSAQVGAMALSELAGTTERDLRQGGTLQAELPQQLRQAFARLYDAMRRHDARPRAQRPWHAP